MEAVSFNEYCRKHLNSERVRLSKSSIENIEGTLKYLDQYSPNTMFIGLNPSPINEDFILGFEKFLYDKNLINNTVNGHLNRLKKYVMNAFYDELIPKNPFRNFKMKSFESFNIYLNNEEIRMVYKVPTVSGSMMERVKEAFVIMCYTGLRYSDVNILPQNVITLNDANNKPVKCIKVISRKTNGLSIIPLHPIVNEILKKYNYQFSIKVDRKYALVYLKRIVKKSGIDSECILTKRKGGEVITVKKMKHELIGLHTGRRSAATNMFLSGIPPLNIMRITGHRTEQAFMKYIKINQEENALQLIGHEYYKPKKHEKQRERKTENETH